MATDDEILALARTMGIEQSCAGSGRLNPLTSAAFNELVDSRIYGGGVGPPSFTPPSSMPRGSTRDAILAAAPPVRTREEIGAKYDEGIGEPTPWSDMKWHDRLGHVGDVTREFGDFFQSVPDPFTGQAAINPGAQLATRERREAKLKEAIARRDASIEQEIESDAARRKEYLDIEVPTVDTKRPPSELASPKEVVNLNSHIDRLYQSIEDDTALPPEGSAAAFRALASLREEVTQSADSGVLTRGNIDRLMRIANEIAGVEHRIDPIQWLGIERTANNLKNQRNQLKAAAEAMGVNLNDRDQK